ncbi:MAG: hypothetical protein WBX15_18900 [Thermoanaerobaculia bacterium]
MSRRYALLVVASIAWMFALASHAAAAGPLFPQPMHLTREIRDPFTRRTIRVDEYYEGDRAVSIESSRSVIADYAKGELTEIDRTRGTYSVTPFAAVANARGGVRTQSDASREGKLEVDAKGSETRLDRSVERFVVRDENAHLVVDVAVDPSIRLSADALDVVTGAAFPSSPDSTSAALRRASREGGGTLTANSTGSGGTFALPVEQMLTWDVDGESVETTNRVVRIGSERVPPELVTIPLGAKEVESRILQRKRLADEIDSLGHHPTPNRP